MQWFAFTLDMLVRSALVGMGAFLLYVNLLYAAPPGTLLGLYPPTTAGAVGYDIAQLAMDALAVWFIYRGVRRRKPGDGATRPAEEARR